MNSEVATGPLTVASTDSYDSSICGIDQRSEHGPVFWVKAAPRFPQRPHVGLPLVHRILTADDIRENDTHIIREIREIRGSYLGIRVECSYASIRSDHPSGSATREGGKSGSGFRLMLWQTSDAIAYV